MFTLAAGGLGRRASDGGANLQVYFQCHLPEGGLSQPNSHEQITKVWPLFVYWKLPNHLNFLY